MATTVKAMFINGIFKPLEDLDFPEGKEVTIIIETPIAPPKKSGIAATAGAWKDTVDCEQLKKIFTKVVRLGHDQR